MAICQINNKVYADDLDDIKDKIEFKTVEKDRRTRKV